MQKASDCCLGHLYSELFILESGRNKKEELVVFNIAGVNLEAYEHLGKFGILLPLHRLFL